MKRLMLASGIALCAMISPAASQAAEASATTPAADPLFGQRCESDVDFAFVFSFDDLQRHSLYPRRFVGSRDNALGASIARLHQQTDCACLG